MCGIVGYIGDKKAAPILIKGLEKLEYRGYDSAGIAVIENNEIVTLKDKGRVKNLLKIDGMESLNSGIGIAHTRWATHGKPSAINSHPHSDKDKCFAVVHNGIIENYKELKEKLKNEGYTFISETDTEVIPNLINYYYLKEKKEDSKALLRAIRNACMDLMGSFAIEVISKEKPNEMVVIRKDSPLIIGKGENENYIASDIPAILPYTRNIYFLDNYEFAYIYKDRVDFYNKNLEPIKKETKEIKWDSSDAEKDGFPHFMLKEIYEQPRAVRETIGTTLDNDKIEIEGLELEREYLKTINKIYIVACGTAMYAGLTARKTIEHLCSIPVEVEVASEFRYNNPLIDEKTLAIYISQSGETADTIAALKLAKSKGAKTIAVANVIGSSITREADYSVYTHAGPEIAVASTKAYTSQITMLTIMAMHFAEILGTSSKNEIEELKKCLLSMPEKIEETLKVAERIKEFAKKIYNEKDVFFLGRGIDYPVCLEGSLKLKEITYIHSEGYASGELKHGPIALIDNGITVVSVITDKDLVEKSLSNVQEVITRGAKILLITNQNKEKKGFEELIKIPETNKFLSPILAIIPLQLLSYNIAVEKKLDVDKPRNLAKSVTVE